MTAHIDRNPFVFALLQLALALHTGARGLRRLAQALENQLCQRRERRTALEELHAMSDRELKDIGITRGDIDRVVRQPSPACNAFRID